MNIINHQSNGAKGLRIAATICVIVGWLFFVIAFIAGIAAAASSDPYMNDMDMFGPWLMGIGALGLMYLIACTARALASLAEAAQVYFNNQAYQSEQTEQGE